ncbi:protein kinase [Embleya sp. NBC_00888]|uniref:serine/threonine-protein kinase n=1 Tax=Embleya sp. NBC_00888 TaxID=2975960 RepID=UPI00386D008D|nr:protein kinase [Embleya sp. NBC_00888]
MKRLVDTDPVTVGRYRTIAELGRGGMGRVLLSSAPDGQLVALKQVRAQFVEDDGFRARFRREVEASRKVSGAYTSAIIDADADAPEPWLTSVFVPGPSLQQAVAAVGALPEESVLRMTMGLASALTEIHRAGLVHRDLKPSNVLLADDGPRVIDFGIARAADSEDGSELTTAGWLVGSPGFMSPEQARGESLEPASDIFSLGTVLVMACTGACPFVGPSLPQTLYNVVHTEPDLSGLPDKIRPIAAGCLAKDPAARPSAAQLLEAIGRLTPAVRPWPLEIHELIAEQQAEIERLRDELRKRTAIPESAAGVVDKPPPHAGRPTNPESPPAPVRRGRAVGTGIAIGIVIAATVIALASGHGSGTDTIADPRATVTAPPQSVEEPTVSVPARPTAPPTVDPTTEAPRRTTAEPTPSAEPSRVTEPSAPPPTAATRQSTRPAAIVSCSGESLAQPESLLLACGDGKDTLKGLTWSGWGQSTARASGQEWAIICRPSCASGGEVHYPTTVILTGLVGGRYTLMQVNTPQSPYGPVAQFTLDSNGPTRRN